MFIQKKEMKRNLVLILNLLFRNPEKTKWQNGAPAQIKEEVSQTRTNKIKFFECALLPMKKANSVF